MQPLFIPGHMGSRFCLFHAAKGRARGAVIYFHPFAEELNKSRRMAALQARSMADAGFFVLQIDLLGCGDSHGGFEDASWQAWHSDAQLAYRWLRERTEAPLTLWGLRAGCLLAASVGDLLPEEANYLFWQPVVSGKQHFQQFMRLKMAGELASGTSKGVIEHLKNQLAASETVEIAGYLISPELADGLTNANLLPPTISAEKKLTWLDLSAKEGADISPATRTAADRWQKSGFLVDVHMVRGPSFWQTSETEVAPELIEATLAALGRAE